MTYRPEWDDTRSAFGGGGRSFLADAPVTKVLLLGMCGILVLTTIQAGFDRSPIGAWTRWLALTRDNVLYVYPFITNIFTHSTRDPFHLLSNAIVLWFFGRSVEGTIGPRRYLALFLGAGLAGTVLHIAMQPVMAALADPYRGWGVLLGASGGALGLVFFTAWKHPHARTAIFNIPLKALAWIILGIDILAVLGSVGRGFQTSDGVAHYGHLGGALFGYLFWRFSLDPSKWGRKVQARVEERVVEHRARVEANLDVEHDRILAKIKREGITALTKSEREIMDRWSKSLNKR